jgi:aminoglycoside 6'-N-acetyltransferase I
MPLAADDPNVSCGTLMGMRVREARQGDLEALMEMQQKLWPDTARADLEPHARSILDGKPASTLPLTLFVAEERAVIGFLEVGLRSHADGCDESRPVGFIEGWFVEEAFRRRGAGRALMAAAEEWSRQQGCKEMGSDTWIDHEDSQKAHAALGYEVVDRCVHFRKPL